VSGIQCRCRRDADSIERSRAEGRKCLSKRRKIYKTTEDGSEEATAAKKLKLDGCISTYDIKGGSIDRQKVKSKRTTDGEIFDGQESRCRGQAEKTYDAVQSKVMKKREDGNEPIKLMRSETEEPIKIMRSEVAERKQKYEISGSSVVKPTNTSQKHKLETDKRPRCRVADCKMFSEANSIYCGEACIKRHCMESLRLIIDERKNSYRQVRG